MIKYGVLTLLFIAGSHLVKAQGTSPVNMTTTAVPFLRINPDTRGGGMGELGIATTPDAGSGLYNLAKTPFATAPSAAVVNYTPWLRDIVQGMYLLQASGYHRLDTFQAVSSSVRYFSLGDVAVSDLSGNHLQTSQPREYALDLGYSRRLSGSVALALAMRYIHSRLASGYIDGTNYQAGNAFAADVSLFYKNNKGFSGGLALSNLGNKIGYTSDADQKNYLPANLGIGIAYNFVFNDQNKLLLGVDGNKLLVPASPTDSASMKAYYSYTIANSWIRSFNNSGYGFSAGVEYNYADLLFLRTGYFYEDNTRGGLHYLTAGVGIRYGVFGLNFSYLAPSGYGYHRNPLANTFRFGLLIN
ncbi:MAG TPA: type IX secretion system outer membrane channel protein PorV [Puia sp.]|nr:type IX secretion system outer membrane channel protein PorV [Puia sp.]